MKITIKTPDSYILSVIYNKVPQSLKVVVFAHGMTVNKDDEGIFVRSEKLLNDAGISTLRFDFRAHGDSTGSSKEDFTITGELTDLEAIVNFAQQEGFEWIGLAGASFGGSIAALYSGDDRGSIHALLLANPVLDYAKCFLTPTTPWAKKYFENALQVIKKDGFVKIGSRQFKAGQRLFDEMQQYFPFKVLDNYKQPLLIVHGTADSKVSHQDARDVYESLHNEYKHFESIGGSEHGFHDEPFESQVTDLITAFFKEKSRSFFTKKIRDNCIASADDFVKSATKLRSAKVPHVQYHLAALALEEIGKAELTLMQHAVDDHSATNFVSSSMDDHIRKLFWAFWGPGFGKKLMTQKQLDDYKGLAQSVHQTRLKSLYADAISTKLAKDNVTQEQADQLLSLAKSRLKMEEHREYEFDKEDPDKDVLKWFLDATKDKEKRVLIFGGKSHLKLVELQGDSRAWIKWLKKQFDENDDEIRAIINEELNRKMPSGKDAQKPKFKIKVKIISDSHTIKTKVLNEWNKHVDFIQLGTDDKHTLYCTFTHSKLMPTQGLWEYGWGIARTFVIALNIATKGFFWWNTPKDIDKYYEEIWDLERNIRLEVKQSPALAINWKKEGFVLSARDLTKTSMVFAWVSDSRETPMEEAVGHYALALAITAKNDIHLRMESSAFREFFLALKAAFRISGDWDGKQPLIDSVKTIFNEYGEFKSLDELISLGEEVEASTDGKTKAPITLTEVFGMKITVDLYFEILAAKQTSELRKRKKKRAEA